MVWKIRDFKMEKMKTHKRKLFIKNIAFFGACMLMLVLLTTDPVLASGADVITNKFNTLKEIVAAIITSLGVIFTLWALLELGTAMQADGGGGMMAQAWKRMGGGLVMCLAPQLLAVLV